MTWFKVDDGLATHPKARRAGLTAMGLWVVSGAYAGHELTTNVEDGYVPEWYVNSWPGSKKAAERLVDVGLWKPFEGGEPGWLFHDWNQANPTRVEELARRREQAKRQAEWRDRRNREKGA